MACNWTVHDFKQPPSLVCIAPVEGATDEYREIMCRGGVPFTSVFEWVANTLRGREGTPTLTKFSVS